MTAGPVVRYHPAAPLVPLGPSDQDRSADDTEVMVAEQVPDTVSANVPNVARVYDYMLGGKDNFPADREAAERILVAFPEAREGVRENRAFLRNVVGYLAGEVGIRQFLDVGAGLPTQQNVHQVAQAVAAGARVVYVDNDPVVCVHGRVLLADTDAVAMVEADLRQPERILNDPATLRLIDFSQPVAVLLVAILHFIGEEEDPYALVARLRDAMAPGSYLVVAHMLDAEQRRSDADQLKQVYARSSAGVVPRTVDEIMRFFDGLEMVDMDRFASPEVRARFSGLGWGGVGRKPIPPGA
jgi:S-adenosyl methyltransferase